MWVKDQDPLQRKSNVTCQVPCSCGYVYIGQKKRAHKTRMKEHKVATRRGDMEKSAIAKCAWNHHHQVDWDKIKVLDKVANIITLLIKEALHICLTDSDTLTNRDKGITISNCWTTILIHAQTCDEGGIKLQPAQGSWHPWSWCRCEVEAETETKPKLKQKRKIKTKDRNFSSCVFVWYFKSVP